MAGVAEFDLARGFALHLDHLLLDRHLLPAVLVAVGVRIVRARLVDVEVFLIHRENGDAERDIVVVADGDAGQRGFARADDRHAGSIEADDIAERGHAQLAMRIVGEDGTAGFGFRGRDDPVVGTFVFLPVHKGGELGCGIDFGALSIGKRGEIDLLGGENVVVEDIGRNVTRIEAGGDDALVAIRIELAAEFVGIDAGSACDTGPGDLGRDVRNERVAADAEDVLGFPCVWRGACQFELDGERFVPSRNLGNIGIDAGREGLDARACVGCVGVPFRLHIAAIEEEAGRPVLLHIGRTERPGEQAEASLAPEIDLPEAVARGVVALQEEGVALRGGEDVRNAPVIDDQLGGGGQAFHPPLIAGNGCGYGVFGDGNECGRADDGGSSAKHPLFHCRTLHRSTSRK